MLPCKPCVCLSAIVSIRTARSWSRRCAASGWGTAAASIATGLSCVLGTGGVGSRARSSSKDGSLLNGRPAGGPRCSFMTKRLRSRRDIALARSAGASITCAIKPPPGLPAQMRSMRDSIPNASMDGANEPTRGRGAICRPERLSNSTARRIWFSPIACTRGPQRAAMETRARVR